MRNNQIAEWRIERLAKVTVLLHHLDEQAERVSNILKHFDDTGTGTDADKDRAWSQLEFCYKTKTPLEYDFDRLNSTDEEQWLEVWREQIVVLKYFVGKIGNTEV